MTALAERLGYEREVVRVWFCNKRQAKKNTIKKLKTTGSSDVQASMAPIPIVNAATTLMASADADELREVDIDNVGGVLLQIDALDKDGA